MSIMKQFNLSGKVALVTGGAQGLGFAMANGLAEAGAKIAIVDIDEDLCKKAAEEIKNSGYEAIGICADVISETQVEKAVSDVISQFGQLDILVTSAGVVKDNSIEDTTLDEWNWHINIDLTGVFLCCKAAVKQMIKQQQGSIINISSMSGIIQTYPQPHIAYASAKGGVIMLTKSLAAEVASKGIRVNCIAPGYMSTRLNIPWIDTDWGRTWLSRIPMGRMGYPEELAGTAVFLASNASSYLTGQTIVIDGGYTIW